MEPTFEMSQRKGDDHDLQLLSGSVASLPAEYAPAFSRLETKQAQKSSCMQYCCIAIFAVISVVALCAAVAAIILVVAFPNVANPAVNEVLVLKDQLTGQLASTPAPSTDTTSEELQRIRETLQSSLSVMTSISNSLEDSTNSVNTLLERLVAGESIANDSMKHLHSLRTLRKEQHFCSLTRGASTKLDLNSVREAFTENSTAYSCT